MRIVFMVVCTFLTIGCTSYQGVRNADPQVTIDEIVSVGESEDVEMAKDLGKLLQNRTKNPETFSAEKTVETMIALRKLNPAVAQNELIELLKDEDEEVRYYSAETLGSVRNSKSVANLANYIEASSEDDVLVIEAASRSLSQLTLVPIHKDGAETKEEWTTWWQANKSYFSEK